MTAKVIIFPQTNTSGMSSVSVILPILGSGLSLDQIAKKDVPAGFPYRIVDAASIPSDFSVLDKQKYSFATPDGHGADYGFGSDFAVVAWVNGEPVIENKKTENDKGKPQPQKVEVQQIISDRQFAQGLAHRGIITNDEALAWVKMGTLPAAIQAFLNSLNAQQSFDTNMILSGATQFDRKNPLVATFGAQVGMNDDALDAFWTYCATL